jgi:5-formyltetrahydrofolate cyclo-ligase
MDKNELRKQMLQRRNALSEQEVLDLSAKVQLVLTRSTRFQSAHSIGAYHSIGSEVRTDSILSEASKLGIRVSLPRVEGDKIAFYQITPDEELVKSRYGILEPPPRQKATDIDLLLIPGVAFDNEGYRIGYGKGYYDRYLQETSSFSVGLAYSFQMTARLPRQQHDKKVSAVATDKGFTVFDD